MKNDHDEYADPEEDARDYDGQADEPTGEMSNVGTSWGDFQFDSPELAAYATYAARSDDDQDNQDEDSEADITENDALRLVPVEVAAPTAAADLEDSQDESADDSDVYSDENDDLAKRLTFDPLLDIDAALAAVGALPDLMAERDSAYEVEHQRQQEAARSAEQHERWRAGYRFAQPPPMRLQRGQPASVIPALILIAVGVYLTFALTLSETPPPPGVIGLLVCGAVGITLLSYWLNARRWARGALFGGLVLIFSGLVFYAVTTPALAAPLPAELVNGGGWRLFIAAFFAALALSGLLARPVYAGLTVLGLGGLAGMTAGFLIDSGTLGTLDSTLAALLREGWKVVLPLAVLLLVVGLLQRLRQHQRRRQLPAI